VRDPILILPVVVAATLIVFGRVNRRRPWGNWVAVAGYSLLAVTALVAFALRS
jgi:hypothetical protein